MTLSEAVDRIKRRTGYGTVGTNTDQATQDILAAFQDSLDEAWDAHYWPFSLNPVTIAVVSGTHTYPLTASDGYLIVLYSAENNKPIHRFDMEEYMEWMASREDSTDQGSLVGYLDLGNNDSDVRQVKIVHTPQSAFTLSGFSKKRLTAYAIADIATNTRIAYFPREHHEAIVIGAIGRIFKIQGKHENGGIELNRSQNRLDKIWSQLKGEPNLEINTRPPTLYRRRRRARGGTTVA